VNGGYQSRLKSVRRETAAMFLCSIVPTRFSANADEYMGQSGSVIMANCGPSHGLHGVNWHHWRPAPITTRCSELTNDCMKWTDRNHLWVKLFLTTESSGRSKGMPQNHTVALPFRRPGRKSTNSRTRCFQPARHVPGSGLPASQARKHRYRSIRSWAAACFPR
jgi:hypothetical protein